MGMEFTTAVKQAYMADSAEDDDGRPEPTPFTIKETVKVEDETGEVIEKVVREMECNAYYPGDGQIGMLLAQIDRTHDVPTRVAGAINFFMAVMDEDSYTYLAGRLMAPDYKDPFGIEDVTRISMWLVEEWTGRPTKASGSSTASRRATGRKSTPRTRA